MFLTFPTCSCQKHVNIFYLRCEITMETQWVTCGMREGHFSADYTNMSAASLDLEGAFSEDSMSISWKDIFFVILKLLPSHIRTSKKENIKTQWSLACKRQRQSHFEEGYEQPLLSAKVAGKKEAAALTPVDNSELVATVTASLEQGARVKAVVVQLIADQTLKATGSFPVLIKKCIWAAKTRK